MWAFEPATHSTRSPSELQGKRAFVLIICLCSPQAWDPGSLFLCEDFNSCLRLSFHTLISRFDDSEARDLSVPSCCPVSGAPLLPVLLHFSSPNPAPLRAPPPSGKSLSWSSSFPDVLLLLPACLGRGLPGRPPALHPFRLLCRVSRPEALGEGVRGPRACLCTVFQFGCISSFALTGFYSRFVPQVSAGEATADFRYFAVWLVGARAPRPPAHRSRAAALLTPCFASTFAGPLVHEFSVSWGAPVFPLEVVASLTLCYRSRCDPS